MRKRNEVYKKSVTGSRLSRFFVYEYFSYHIGLNGSDFTITSLMHP